MGDAATPTDGSETATAGPADRAPAYAHRSGGGWLSEEWPCGPRRAGAPLVRKPPGSEALTSRERRVLTELALGKTTDEIAASICLSTHTVRSHVKRAMSKLGARTRSQAVAIALRDQLIAVEGVLASQRSS